MPMWKLPVIYVEPKQNIVKLLLPLNKNKFDIALKNARMYTNNMQHVNIIHVIGIQCCNWMKYDWH